MVIKIIIIISMVIYWFLINQIDFQNNILDNSTNLKKSLLINLTNL